MWKSKPWALNCKFEMCYQLGRGNKLLEQSIDKGENPVCYLQPPVHGVLSKSHVPWDWCMKQVVIFI